MKLVVFAVILVIFSATEILSKISSEESSEEEEIRDKLDELCSFVSDLCVYPKDNFQFFKGPCEKMPNPYRRPSMIEKNPCKKTNGEPVSQIDQLIATLKQR